MNFGDKVRIKPGVEHRVHFAPGRPLVLEEGQPCLETVWTPYLAERVRTGEIERYLDDDELEALRAERAAAAEAEAAKQPPAPLEAPPAKPRRLAKE